MGLPLQWIAAGVGFGYLLSSGTISLRQVGTLGALLVGGAMLALYKFQESLLYQPRIFPQHITPKDNPPGMRHPGEHALPYEEARLQTADGLELHAWLLRPEEIPERKSRATIVFFHENAGNMGLRMESIKSLYEQLDVNLAIISYRGSAAHRHRRSTPLRILFSFSFIFSVRHPLPLSLSTHFLPCWVTEVPLWICALQRSRSSGRR